jgi:GST-like protein
MTWRRCPASTGRDVAAVRQIRDEFEPFWQSGSHYLDWRRAMQTLDLVSKCRDGGIHIQPRGKERPNNVSREGTFSMIDLHYWTTPNGHKIAIFLEESALPYKIIPVNIGKGEQFRREFLDVSPNNRIPAIVDHAPADGGKPLAVFESGAILLYLADKTGKFITKDLRGRTDAIQWLFWQMGNLGPMAGQNNHFNNYAVEKLPYAMDRYRNEVNRLYGVLNRRLADRPFIAGDYSIADIASYPWIVPYERQGQKLEDFPHVKRWFEAVRARPAVERAYAKAKEVNPTAGGIRTAEERAILFGQTAASVQSATR